jgi:hypothetical protein
MFTLPIPCFNAGTEIHSDLAGAEAEIVAAKVELPDDIYFTTARSRVRDALAAAGISQRIDALVADCSRREKSPGPSRRRPGSGTIRHDSYR